MAALSRWFHSFRNGCAQFVEDLELSLSYFKKNTEPSLYARAYGDMLRFDKLSHDGPLLFKLICNETTTTNESN